MWWLAVACANLVGPNVPAVFQQPAEKFCQEEGHCAGPFAAIEVWNDTHGAPRRLVLTGDLSQCSHVSTRVYDEQLKELWAAGDRPVSVEDADARTKEREAVFAGMTRATSATCGDLGLGKK